MYGPLKELIRAKDFPLSPGDELFASDHQPVRDYIAHHGLPSGLSDELKHALTGLLGCVSFVIDELTSVAGAPDAAAIAEKAAADLAAQQAEQAAALAAQQAADAAAAQKAAASSAAQKAADDAATLAAQQAAAQTPSETPAKGE